MPKVTQEYRDARRAEIVAAAKRCFLRDGFHETSMQDLFAEAGVSSGAFYRYFRSKDDVILAIALENIGESLGLIHALTTGGEDDIGAALATVLETLRRRNRDGDIGALAVLMWSECLRNPELAAELDARLGAVRRDLAVGVRRAQGAGTLPSGVRADALARLLTLIVPGFLLQLAIFGDRAVAGVPDALRALLPTSA